MHLHVRFVNEDRSTKSPEMIQEILLKQLQRFEHRLRQVQMYIEDVNGPRGGVDKHCRCVLHLRRMAPIVISDSDSSVMAMVHRVADRASHALSRNLERQGQHRHGPSDSIKQKSSPES